MSLNVEKLQKSIKLLEGRISALDKDLKSKEENTVFPPSCRCLYYNLLGENYYKLLAHHFPYSDVAPSEDSRYSAWSAKCLSGLESAMKIASQVFDPNESKLRALVFGTFIPVTIL
jgi:hypothetical protein